MNIVHKGALAAVCLAAFAACNSSNNSTPPTPTPGRPLAIAYTAIGASDAVGYGASVPCTVASPALVADPTCPETNASGYVPDIVRDFASAGFAASLQDLGISGAVIGPDIRAMGNTYGSLTGPAPCQPRTGNDQIPADFLTNELPSVNPAATFVTIFAGGNDINAIANALGCGAGGVTVATQTAFITQEVTAFGNDFAQLAGAVHAKAPGAIIVVANDPNFANVPYVAHAPAATRQALQVLSNAIDTNVINQFPAAGIPVVDLQCNPQSYVPANFYTDGFHPNDTGYALLAQQFIAIALHQSGPYPAPLATCPEQAIQAGARVPMTQPIARFE